MHLHLTTVALIFSGHVAAQVQSVVVPSGTATTAGNTAALSPFGGGSPTPAPAYRLLAIYSATDFAQQGVAGPIEIVGLRWRPDDGVPAYAGGVFPQAEIALATSAVDPANAAHSFRANYSNDRLVCYSGAVTHGAGGGTPAGSPAPWTVDVTLSHPFYYDPMAGSLVVDVDYLDGGSYSGSPLPGVDSQDSASASRVFTAPSTYPYVGDVQIGNAPVVEIRYLPAQGGTALAREHGLGCYDSSSSFYERFAPGTVDLANRTLWMIPTGTGYNVFFGPNAWHTPNSPPIASGGGVSGPFPLGFSIAHPGGVSSDVYAGKDGNVWAEPRTALGQSTPRVQTLLGNEAVWSPLWSAYDIFAGALHFDTDPTIGAAYVTLVDLPELGTGVKNTFQVALFSSGVVQYRYQQLGLVSRASLTGFSVGHGSKDPRDRDLTSSTPFTTAPDANPIVLHALERPVVGSSVPLRVDFIPAASQIGFLIGGLMERSPGLELSAFGMPGCWSYTSQDASLAFAPNNGQATITLGIPNDSGLTGTSIYLQGLSTFSASNPLGALSSNAVTLTVGLR